MFSSYGIELVFFLCIWSINGMNIAPPADVEADLAYHKHLEKYEEPSQVKNLKKALTELEEENKELKEDNSFLKFMVDPVMANLDKRTKKSMKEEETRRINPKNIAPPADVEADLAYHKHLEKYEEPSRVKKLVAANEELEEKIKELEEDNSFLKFMVDPVMANLDKRTKKSVMEELKLPEKQ